MNEPKKQGYTSYKSNTFFLVVLPAVNKTNKAVINMVTGIRNSTKEALTDTTLYTDKTNARVCPTVKILTKKKNALPVFKCIRTN